MANIATYENTAIAETDGINSDTFVKWLNYIDATPKTVETYNRNIRQFFVYLKANGIKQPVREDIIAYREYLKQDHKPTTVQGYLTTVKLFFKWTDLEGIYPDIAKHIKGVKIDATEHKKDYLTKNQVTRLLNSVDRNTLKGKRDYAILWLMLTTGLREISVVRANISDIRPAGDITALYYQGKGRDEKAVYVELTEPTETAIREYLEARKPEASSEPLFTSVAHRNGGQRMTTKSISRLIKEYLLSIGLDSDRLTAHSLRHTAATFNLLAGASVEETQQLLDHRNINTTLIYSHALQRAANKSEQRIADFILA